MCPYCGILDDVICLCKVKPSILIIMRKDTSTSITLNLRQAAPSILNGLSLGPSPMPSIKHLKFLYLLILVQIVFNLTFYFIKIVVYLLLLQIILMEKHINCKMGIKQIWVIYIFFYLDVDFIKKVTRVVSVQLN